MYTYTSSAVDTSTYAAIGKVNISGSAVITSSDGELLGLVDGLCLYKPHCTIVGLLLGYW